jgi:hypothetical protein
VLYLLIFCLRQRPSPSLSRPSLYLNQSLLLHCQIPCPGRINWGWPVRPKPILIDTWGIVVVNCTNPFWSDKKHARLFQLKKNVHCTGCGRRAAECKRVADDVVCDNYEEVIDSNRRKRREDGV